MPGINSSIDEANNILMQYWPLKAFTATNPLWELRKKPFLDVVSHPNFQSLMEVEYYYEFFQKKQISNHDLQQAIKMIEKRSLNEEEVSRWTSQSREKTTSLKPRILLSQQIDEYQFQKPKVWIKERIFTLLRDYFGSMHYKETNLIHFWRQENKIKNTEVKQIQSMPVKEAIAFLLNALNIPEEKTVNYFEAIYLEIYGWAGFMNWRNHHPTNPWTPGKDDCALILLFWLTYEYTMAIDKNISYLKKPTAELNTKQKGDLKQRYIWQTAFELSYMNQLDSKLNVNAAKEKITYDAQFIFCIDTRSEGFRRHLEAEEKLQTFGFAGFFGAIFNLKDEDEISYQAPALVESSHLITATKRKNLFRLATSTFKKTIAHAKKQLAAPFALFEMIGFWHLPFMIFKTIQPKLKKEKKAYGIKINHNFSTEEQFQSAYNLLTSIGLVSHFSPYVFICAHQTDNLNNPFKSSLNCGACGGNSGVPNALVMCDILNDKKIRLKLENTNIVIPKNTQFIPASHHTSNDRLEIIRNEIPASLEKSIIQAAENLRKEKSKSLAGQAPLSEREQSWSELIPELGLINNACIIIGPRSLTRSQNLERKAFLHSYEPALDPDGDILSAILSAPAIVAHWINSQYYFSTTNPDLFGAGNKAIHNVLPGIGVLEGNLSDLKVGLPLQSTYFQSKPIHEPRRITVVVYAHKKILDSAIEKSPDFKMLLDNQWIYLKHKEA